MKEDTIEKLKAMFAEDPIMCAGSADVGSIEALERFAGFTLPEDYKQFLGMFGGGIVGAYPIYGINTCELLSASDTADKQTLQFRSDGWPGIDNILVVSTDHSGNPIGITRAGDICISDHDFGAVQKLADSFEEYLLNWCLNA